jgi:hypothetical protein
MIKKLLVGVFIAYNLLIIPVSYAADAVMSTSVDSDQKETIVKDIESKDSIDTNLDKKDISDLKEIKNGGGISLDTNPVNLTACDSTNTPSITVLSPNGGEVYIAGQQIEVKWESCNLPANSLIAITLTVPFISLDIGLVNPVVNDGYELVTLPSSSTIPVYGNIFKIKIQPTYSINSPQDLSDNLFTINYITPSLTLVSPNGGEIYHAGQQITVTWSHTNAIPPGQLIGIDLEHLQADGATQAPSDANGSPVAILDNGQTLVSAGSAVVTIPNFAQTIGTDYYRISIFWWDAQTSTGWQDVSDSYFHVLTLSSFCNPDDSTTVPEVDLLSPNGGEHYLPLEMPVTWRTCMIPSTTLMKIDLVMSLPGGGTLTRNLATTPNDGIQTVSLPNTTTWPQMVYGNNFKVSIYPSTIPSYGPHDQSNQNFSIAPARIIVATDPSTPPFLTHLVSNTAGTNNIALLKFTVHAEESNVTLRKIPVILASGPGDISSKINTVRLYRDTNQLDSVDGSSGINVSGGVITSGSCTDACGFIFSNLNEYVLAGTTASFTVSVDIKALNGNYPGGFGLTASISNGDVILPAHLSVMDANGDLLAPSQRSGDAYGQTQYFVTTCIHTVMGSSTTNQTLDNGSVVAVTYTIPLTVTSCGSGTQYIGQTAQQADIATGMNAFGFVFQNSTAPAVSVTNNIAATILSSSDAVIEGNAYRLDDGTTKHFTLTVTLLTPSSPNSFYRVALKQIRTFTNPSLTVGEINTNLTPVQNYQTGFQFINN